MDLLTYQGSREQELEHSANLAYARGDVDGAIGYIQGLARQLGIKLPQRPLQMRSVMANRIMGSRYYFLCINIIAENRHKNIEEIRAKYGRPFEIKAAKAA